MIDALKQVETSLGSGGVEDRAAAIIADEIPAPEAG
jgi:hypothetical protein